MSYTYAKLSKLLVKSTNGVITKYVYGFGLIGEETSGVFKTYHYDFRGSTVAITDTTGSITDTFVYDTYGKLISRTGVTSTPFMYNGRDGVMTESNGLNYMRARFYYPELKRFINSDIIAGNISDAVTLNRYAYANGNPVSNIDPFGLSAERGSLGSIQYNGNSYSIYVPNDLETTLQANWKTIDQVTDPTFSFDYVKFFTGINLDDMDGIADGSNTNVLNMMTDKQKTAVGLGSIFTGVLNSLRDSISNTYITYVFQQCGDQRRVIIKAGSSSVEQIFNTCANDVPMSMYDSAYGNPLGQVCISNSARSLYEDLTGDVSNSDGFFDVSVTFDSRHKGEKYASYLWIDGDGTIMQTPILYENDKVEIAKRDGFLNLGYESLLDVPINYSIPVSEEYQELFSTAF